MFKMLIAIFTVISVSAFANDMKQEIKTNDASAKRLAAFLNGRSLNCEINKNFLVRIDADLDKTGSVRFAVTNVKATDYFGDGPISLQTTADWFIVSDAPADMEQYLMLRLPNNNDLKDQTGIAAAYILNDPTVGDGSPSTTGIMCNVK